MNRLPIADCRLPIGNLLARRGDARCSHDSSEFVSFFQKRGELPCWHDVRFHQKFQPQCGFIGFLLDSPDFRDEFSLTAGTATGAIIRGYRSSAANDLFGDDSSCIVVFWNRPCKFDYSEREGFGSGFQFGRVHGANLQTQSAIGNWQSAIQR